MNFFKNFIGARFGCKNQNPAPTEFAAEHSVIEQLTPEDSKPANFPLLTKADLLVHSSFLGPLFRDSESTLTQDDERHSLPPVDQKLSKFSRSSFQIERKHQVQGESHSLQTLPVEIFIMIAMSSGFRTAMKLRATNRKFRQILSQTSSWTEFTERTPDLIHTRVTIETKLHQFDQILFAQWPVKSNSSSPCIIHRTFLEQYDFLGGLSLKINPSGMVYCDFFEHRERLPCYIADVQQRMTSGSIPQVITTDESPVGGVRVEHSCSDCKHYDQQQIIKSEFVHQTMVEVEDISHKYHIDSNHDVTVIVTSINSVFGYNSEIPCVSTKIWKIDGIELDKGLHNFYLKYVC